MKPEGRRWRRGGLQGSSAVLSCTLTCTRTHGHAQLEVGRDPTDSGSSWFQPNDIFTRAELHSQCTNTRCHLRLTTTGVDAPRLSPTLTHAHTHTKESRPATELRLGQ